MYAFPEMLGIGLRGREWPSDRHRQLAEAIALGNPRIRTADSLIEAVTWVIERPQYFVDNPKLTLGQCVDEGWPF